MKFKEKIDDIVKNLKAQITTETSADDVTKIEAIIKDVQGLEEDHNKVVEDGRKFKEKYINMIDNFGTDQVPDNEASDTPKSFEEIVADFEKEELKKSKK